MFDLLHRLYDYPLEYVIESLAPTTERDFALLPADRQELLNLKFVERLSNAEIGDVMGRSEGAIKSLYHRTLLSLRKDMKRLQKPKR